MGKITDLKNSETIVRLARAALLFQYCPITHKSGESINAAAIPELNIDMIHGNKILPRPGGHHLVRVFPGAPGYVVSSMFVWLHLISLVTVD